MKVISNEKVIFFDVDDTIVMWGNGAEAYTAPAEGDPTRVKIKNYWLKPNEAHIKALKAHAQSGCTIIVWSAGGAAWAEEVVRALNLVPFVSLCIGKPILWYDDLNCCQQFQYNRRYLKDE